ncbi:MAG: 50S ribosome-binding GTPase [Planctomycetes bacterium]|nr:50S ribosome-binding GTPase [Planctomycetota bacterium]
MAGSPPPGNSGQSSGLPRDAAAPGRKPAAGKKQEESLARTVLLVGNLNVGKTTLFNRVCGRRLTTSNYPGTSIAIGRGTLFEGGTEIHLIDTPGVNGMMPESEDEKITQDILFSERPDAIAVVADGKNLRKSLLLVTHLVEYDIPLLLDINMMDEVRQRGVHIDAERLSALLNVPVVETVASEGEGVGAFRRTLTKAGDLQMPVSYPVKVESGLARISELLAGSRLPPRAAAVALLVGEHDIKERVGAEHGADVLERIETIVETVRAAFSRPLSAIILEARLRAVDQLLSAVQSVSPPARMPFSEKIGEWSRRPLTGIPIAALVIGATYLFVGQLGLRPLWESSRESCLTSGSSPLRQGPSPGFPAHSSSMLLLENSAS